MYAKNALNFHTYFILASSNISVDNNDGNIDYDGGDCRPTNITKWPECPHNPFFIGDGICDDHLKDKSECNHDGGDCCDGSLWGNKICNGFNNFMLTDCANYNQNSCTGGDGSIDLEDLECVFSVLEPSNGNGRFWA